MQDISKLQKGHMQHKYDVNNQTGSKKMGNSNECKTSMLDAALEHAENGTSVFPIEINGKKPLTKHGFKDATTNSEQIESWWTQWPEANIATPTGTSQGIGVTIDRDGVDNPWPKEPDSQLSLDKGVRVDTPSGGSHHHFLLPEGKSWRTSEIGRAHV